LIRAGFTIGPPGFAPEAGWLLTKAVKDHSPECGRREKEWDAGRSLRSCKETMAVMPVEGWISRRVVNG